MSAIAVLDIGKTNVKLVLFKDEAIVWQQSQSNQVVQAPPYPHADVDAIWRFFMSGLREAHANHPISNIVVTTHGATLALLGRDGLALPVMDYEFSGLDALDAEYNRIRPPFSETLSPPIATGLNAGKQLFYQQKYHPDAFARVQAIVPYAQYFVWRLTGTIRNEITGIGCHSDLWATNGQHLSSLVAKQGWDRLFPPFAHAYDSAGPLTQAVQTETGLPQTVQVRFGIHDSNGSILPHLLSHKTPFTLVSTGTWVVIMALGIKADRLDPALDMLAYADVEGRPLPAAKFMGGREYATILDGAPANCSLDDVAAVLHAGVLALPCFAASGGPFAGRTPAITGCLPPGDTMRAALASLYCALTTDYLLTALGAESGPVLVEGGFAANTAYCAVLAGLRPAQAVMTGTGSGGTAYGASLLATWPQPPQPPSMRLVQPYCDITALHAYRSAWLDAVDTQPPL